MDVITHILVPYAILTLVKNKNKLAGVVGGISLDFDLLIIWIGILAPEYFIFTHRGITHSFIFGFFTSLIFLFILSRKPVKEFISSIMHRNINIEFNKSSILIVYFGAITHLILDFLTTKGIPLLYPFSIVRYSAEIYYYIDPITFGVGAVVLFILYLRLNSNYKKFAMAFFIILLVSFGCIRGYEKINAIETATITSNGSCNEISAYPTTNMFVWNVVKNDHKNKKYNVFRYDALKNRKLNIGDFNSVSIENGSQKSAENALKIANAFPEVERFKWNAYYTCVDAKHNSERWKITYYDFLGTSWGRNSLTVSVS